MRSNTDIEIFIDALSPITFSFRKSSNIFDTPLKLWLIASKIWAKNTKMFQTLPQQSYIYVLPIQFQNAFKKFNRALKAEIKMYSDFGTFNFDVKKL